MNGRKRYKIDNSNTLTFHSKDNTLVMVYCNNPNTLTFYSKDNTLVMVYCNNPNTLTFYLLMF
jgi:uncharacterized protein YlbG (UPF0298 family)